MTNQLFRQKSLDRISSPEELHDYMRVTSPRLWMILGAIVLLLAGFIVYASTATMENTLPIKVEVANISLTAPEEDGVSGMDSVCVTRAELPESYQRILQTGMVMRLGDEHGKIEFLATFDDENGSKLNVIFEMENPNFYLPDGIYDGVLVLESTTPISFLWN